MSKLTASWLFIALLTPFAALADHASANFETGSAGAIMTIPGSTMPHGKLVAGTSIQVIEFNAISDTRLAQYGAIDQDVHSTDSLLKLSLTLAYGLTDDLTLGVNVPYVERHNIRAAANDNGMGEVELAGTANGLGDTSLFGQYRLYHTAVTDVAALVGIMIPTGSTSERENGGGLFEADHQPGWGAWDPFLGLSFNRSWGSTGLSANILYTFETQGAQNSEVGEILNYNIALSRRVLMEAEHHHHDEQEDTESLVEYIDLMLELNGDLRDKLSVNGAKNFNHGGHLLYLSPGIKLGLGHHWTLYASAGIPVFNGLYGIQSEPNYRIITGLSYVFE